MIVLLACLSQEASRMQFSTLCGGPVKLVEAWLCARKYLQSSFNHCGGAVNLV